MLRVIWRYILTLKIKIHIKDKHWNSVIFIIILEVFTNFVTGHSHLLGKECTV